LSQKIEMERLGDVNIFSVEVSQMHFNWT
jgi:hypothetical protein